MAEITLVLQATNFTVWEQHHCRHKHKEGGGNIHNIRQVRQCSVLNSLFNFICSSDPPCVPWPGGGLCPRAGILIAAAPGALTTRSWGPRAAAWPALASAGAGWWPGSLWRPTQSGSDEAAGRGWRDMRWRVRCPASVTGYRGCTRRTGTEHGDRWMICCAEHVCQVSFSWCAKSFISS